MHESERSARRAWARALENSATFVQRAGVTLPVLIETVSEKAGTAPALVSERQTLSYSALAARVQYYARWALRQKLTNGGVVCLLMRNSPEYFAIWLGITKVGGTVSLLNTHLVGTSLAHCIRIADPQHIIVDSELAEGLSANETIVVDVVTDLEPRAPEQWVPPQS